MARPNRHVPRDSSRRRLWVYLGIVAFIVVDILLIVWALGSGAGAGDATTAPTEVTATTQPAPSASSSPVAQDPVEATPVAMVGLAQADCTPQLVRTFVGGSNFSSKPAELPGAWYLDPADRASVHGPAGILVRV